MLLNYIDLQKDKKSETLVFRSTFELNTRVGIMLDFELEVLN
jgi:hypothetical protein